jgi:Uma2 family endonuclease
MSAPASERLTEQEYLARERRAQTKSEYLGGRVFALAGASERHVLITGNVFAALHAQLRGRACRVYSKDLRVKVGPAGFYAYPDIAVVCGEPRFEDTELDTLLNPTLIIEVLSPATESYDRGKKFELYRKIETFVEYLLIAQDRPFLEHHLRRPDGSWLMHETTSLDAVLLLESIECRLAAKDVYERVEVG